FTRIETLSTSQLKRQNHIVDEQNEYIFNDEKFGLIKLKNKTLLFDKSKFITYPLPKHLYETIKYFCKPHKIKDTLIGNYLIKQKALKDLISSSIFIPKTSEK